MRAITRIPPDAYLSAMAMTWDALLVSALAEELKVLLRNARLRGHRFRWEEREITLFFREGTLRWHLHPLKGWLTLSPGEQELPAEARPLSAQLLDIVAPRDERLLEFRLQRVRGRNRALRMVVELMTNQWNALLLEGEEGRIRHLLWTRRLEDRTLAVGQRYRPPEPSSRRGIRDPLTREEWDTLLRGKDPEGARRALLEEAAFTSPLNVGWVMGPGEDLGEAWGGGDREHTDPEDPGPGPDGGRDPGVSAAGGGPAPDADPIGLRRWKALRAPLQPQPCVLEIGGDKNPYPIVLKNYSHICLPSLITAIEAVARDQAATLDPADEVRERLERALHRAVGRTRGIRKEMAQAADPDEPREQANLLLARLGEVPRGADSVLLQGFGGEGVRISLNPSLNPQENAKALYQEAARRERARDRLPPLLAEAEREVRELELLKEELERGSIPPAAASARIPGRKPAPGPGRKQEIRTPYRRYLSSGGLEIRVGRSARENDLLTFRHSHSGDVWLHARDRAGAHVVLRWREEGNPPHRDLSEAAILAAVFSGARTSGTVPVDWTRRKYVRKPRKAPPGTVLLDRSKTLFVEPDPGLPDRLKWRKGEGEEG